MSDTIFLDMPGAWPITSPPTPTPAATLTPTANLKRKRAPLDIDGSNEQESYFGRLIKRLRPAPTERSHQDAPVHTDTYLNRFVNSFQHLLRRTQHTITTRVRNPHILAYGLRTPFQKTPKPTRSPSVPPFQWSISKPPPTDLYPLSEIIEKQQAHKKKRDEFLSKFARGTIHGAGLKKRLASAKVAKEAEAARRARVIPLIEEMRRENVRRFGPDWVTKLKEKEEKRREEAKKKAIISARPKKPHVKPRIETPPPSPPPQLIPDLPSEMESRINDTLQIKDRNAEISAGVARKDIGTVLPTLSTDRDNGWLNDVAIDTVLARAVAAANKSRGWEKRSNNPAPFWAFNSAAIKSMSEKGAASISSWSRRGNLNKGRLLASDTIFFPVNLSGNHWTLLMVHPQRREIHSLDSMSGKRAPSARVVGLARDWLKMELGEGGEGGYREEDWVVVEKASAQQTNGSDCGVFTVWNALAALKGADSSVVVPEDMAHKGRRYMAAAMIDDGLFTGFGL
ncbi:MAG: hypothetical protein M1820_008183 [Bogoriella megaspora]|nr:MAG: hypothetical protein M1820_008183 [Bogoriella megaspora]